MIQVYSQEKRMEKISASQYYLSKDTYQGVHFEIKEEVHEEFDVFVRLHGACTVPDDSYAVINLTWPIQPERRKWIFIRRKTAGISALPFLYPERQTIRPSCHTGTGYTQNFITGPRIRKRTCPGTGT